MKGLDSLVLLTELGVDSSERIDEGLAFESSAFESLYCGQHSRKKKRFRILNIDSILLLISLLLVHLE